MQLLFLLLFFLTHCLIGVHVQRMMVEQVQQKINRQPQFISITMHIFYQLCRSEIKSMQDESDETETNYRNDVRTASYLAEVAGGKRQMTNVLTSLLRRKRMSIIIIFYHNAIELVRSVHANYIIAMNFICWLIECVHTSAFYFLCSILFHFSFCTHFSILRA